MHPSILTNRGLHAAAEALAQRSGLSVDVQVPDERYPPHIEAAAYSVIAEALTEVSRILAPGQAAASNAATAKPVPSREVTSRSTPSGHARDTAASAVIGLLIISPIGRSSGGHFNPAVTVTLWLLRGLPGRDAAAYVAAQFAVGSGYRIVR